MTILQTTLDEQRRSISELEIQTGIPRWLLELLCHSYSEMTPALCRRLSDALDMPPIDLWPDYAEHAIQEDDMAIRNHCRDQAEDAAYEAAALFDQIREAVDLTSHDIKTIRSCIDIISQICHTRTRVHDKWEKEEDEDDD